ncbi:hypothetical protein [Hahella ganghwensis]|uniref:hypothetical protein n=1 Tax=Hahella ganghwensis TaxID=286420 RepID=UPI00036C64FA|nr:hypothetical protein [Hahella ganghwensis]
MSDKNQNLSEVEEQITFNGQENTAQSIRDKYIDAMTPGYQVEFDPVEAELVGAFVEDALSEEDATESTLDLPEIDIKED